tara:strand:- start:6069 stop:6440 length:372 start_codon:yes stop_codon:yes gene_type:complete
MACVSRDLTSIIPVPSRNTAARFHTLCRRGTRRLATLRRGCNIFEKLWNNLPGLGKITPKPGGSSPSLAQRPVKVRRKARFGPFFFVKRRLQTAVKIAPDKLVKDNNGVQVMAATQKMEPYMP